MSRFIWYVKQLFPLTYRSRYGEEGKRHFAVWKMWLGKVYDYDDVIIQ